MEFETLFCFGKEKAHSRSGDMRYDEYLPQGFPIGTNISEGACCYLLRDRVEQFCVRWTQPGARAVLDLRAVCGTDRWDKY